MVKIKARIKLFKSGRKTSFSNGYRPLFNFVPTSSTSGSIQLISSNEFMPGDEQVVEITFLNNKFLGKDFATGKKFSFGEGREPLGEGSVIKILK